MLKNNLIKTGMIFWLVLLFSNTAQAGPGSPQFKSFKKCFIQVTDFTADYSMHIPKWAIKQLADTLASFLDAYYPNRFLSVYRTGHFDKQEPYLKVVGRISKYSGPKLGGDFPIESSITIIDDISMSLSIRIILSTGNRRFGNPIEVEYMVKRDELWEIGPIEDLIVQVARIAAIQIGEEKYRQ